MKKIKGIMAIGILMLLALGILSPVPASAASPPGIPWAWGSNFYGELGFGTNTNSNLPGQVSSLTGVTAVSGGGGFSLAVDSAGNAWAWGRNDAGQLGIGTTANINVPVRISTLSNVFEVNVSEVAAGSFHGLALDSGGSVFAWGDNYYGELGNGTNTSSNTPGMVSSLSNVTAISAAGYFSLALDSGGNVWAWGDNNSGQLGNGSNINSNVPVQVSSLSNVTAISAGGGHHSLALDSAGNVWAWGSNFYGGLGNGTNTNSTFAVQVPNINSMIAVSAGSGHSLALDSSGNVWAWGKNDLGQLGIGTTTNSNIPVLIDGLSNIIAISAGSDHSLALDSGGNVWAWGNNPNGQLGNGTNTTSNTPVQVSNLIGVDAIEAGEVHSLAIIAATPAGNPSTTSTQLSASSIALGQSVAAAAIVLGDGVTVPTGTVTFEVSTDGGNTWNSFGTDKTLSANAIAASDPYTPPAAGSYYFRAVYSGDANYSGSQSGNTDEPLTVTGASISATTTTTQLSASSITQGQSVTDTATVTGNGLIVPTGTVTFQYSFDAGLFLGWHTYDVKNLANGAATSSPYTTDSGSPVRLYFRAVYGGDANYSGSQSGIYDEQLAVTASLKPSTTITRLSSLSYDLTGLHVYEFAYVIGDGFIQPTGTVTFQVSTNGGTSWDTFGVPKVLVNGGAHSDAYSPPVNYSNTYFRAIYSGDSNYSPSQSGNLDDRLLFKHFVAITLQLSNASIVLGQSVTATAAVAGVSEMPTGTLTFQVGQIGSNGGTTWTNFGVAKSLTGSSSIVITSDPYTPPALGAYQFRAYYSGDDNYYASNSVSTTLEVTNSAVTTLLSSSAITLGQSVTDAATVNVAGNLAPTGTVTFQWSLTGSVSDADWTTYSTRTLGGKGIKFDAVTSDPFTPTSAGVVYFRAVYSGDANYTGSKSGLIAEPLLVNKAPTRATQKLTKNVRTGVITVTASISEALRSSGGLPQASGTWTVQASKDKTFASGVVVAGSGAVTGVLPFTFNTSFTPPSIGAWYVRFEYSGDSNFGSCLRAVGKVTLR